MTDSDFEFGWGQGRYFKGRGFIGLVALILVLAGAVTALFVQSNLVQAALQARPIPAHSAPASFVQ